MSKKSGIRSSVESILATLTLSIAVALVMTIPVGAAAPSQAADSLKSTPSSAQALNASLTPGNNVLDGVSCSGPSACTAVGSISTETKGQSLVESWNGSVWSIMPTHLVPPREASELNGVSCSGPSACTAVGSRISGTTRQTLIESWNGSAWTVVPSPNTSPNQVNSPTGVSCSGPSSCIAVGYYVSSTFPTSVDQTLTESWNGSTWSVVLSPNVSPNQTNELNGVSCSGPTACTAVGAYLEGSTYLTLIESWNGSVWSIVPSPNVSPAQNNFLQGVSCSGPAACTAVGSYDNNAAAQTLIESWNGSVWSIAPSPNSSPDQGNFLAGVSCSGPTACTAVGQYSTNAAFQTLIESWNGSLWSIVPSPNTSSNQENELFGVSCSGPTACTAAGIYVNGGYQQTLIESWHGSTWSIVPSPNVGIGVTITTTSLPGGTVGSAYSATLAASGGNPPYHWRLASGSSLPKGLKLDPVTGVISGTPARVGTFTFTVEVHARPTRQTPNFAEATFALGVA